MRAKGMVSDLALDLGSATSGDNGASKVPNNKRTTRLPFTAEPLMYPRVTASLPLYSSTCSSAYVHIPSPDPFYVQDLTVYDVAQQAEQEKAAQKAAAPPQDPAILNAWVCYVANKCPF